jgi:hypothetical protein
MKVYRGVIPIDWEAVIVPESVSYVAGKRESFPLPGIELNLPTCSQPIYACSSHIPTKYVFISDPESLFYLFSYKR